MCCVVCCCVVFVCVICFQLRDVCRGAHPSMCVVGILSVDCCVLCCVLCVVCCDLGALGYVLCVVCGVVCCLLMVACRLL